MIGHSYCELGHRQLCSLLQHCDTSVSIFTGNFLLDNIGSIYAVQLVYILTREAAMLLYDLGSGSWIFYRRYRKSFARRYLTVKTQQILGLWDPCLVTSFKEDCFRQIFKFLFAPKIYPGRLIQTLHSKTGIYVAIEITKICFYILHNSINSWKAAEATHFFLIAVTILVIAERQCAT